MACGHLPCLVEAERAASTHHTRPVMTAVRAPRPAHHASQPPPHIWFAEQLVSLSPLEAYFVHTSPLWRVHGHIYHSDATQLRGLRLLTSSPAAAPHNPLMGFHPSSIALGCFSRHIPWKKWCNFAENFPKSGLVDRQVVVLEKQDCALRAVCLKHIDWAAHLWGLSSRGQNSGSVQIEG